MTTSSQLLHQIEQLRQKLHQGLGSQYDPVRMQELVSLSEELNRLTVEWTRRELGVTGHDNAITGG